MSFILSDGYGLTIYYKREALFRGMVVALTCFFLLDGCGIEHLGLKVPADSDRRPLKEIMNETDYEYIDAPSNVQ